MPSWMAEFYTHTHTHAHSVSVISLLCSSNLIQNTEHFILINNTEKSNIVKYYYDLK